MASLVLLLVSLLTVDHRGASGLRPRHVAGRAARLGCGLAQQLALSDGFRLLHVCGPFIRDPERPRSAAIEPSLKRATRVANDAAAKHVVERALTSLAPAPELIHGDAEAHGN